MLVLLYYIISVIFTYYLIKIIDQYVYPYLSGKNKEKWDWESIRICFSLSIISFVGLFGYISYVLCIAVSNKIKDFKIINKNKPPRWL